MSASRVVSVILAVAAALSGGVLAGCALTPGRVPGIVKARDARPMTVATASGPVTGAATPDARAFLGIPFAAPPVGPLRFRAPRPPANWTAARDATHAGPHCIQKHFPGSPAQSEDCLTLNVYTDATASPAAPEPVMVWFYGGGFAIGANDNYDLSQLARRQHVVVVAPNYRLGPFGFLAHPALEAEHDGSGDFAVLDQQAALRWVQANIAGFGGDPANVTLFGESAGGWSVCYQLASPAARGLFQKAIIESGACTSPDSALPAAMAEAGGTRMAADLGCDDPASAAACLRALPAARPQGAKARRRGILGKDSWAPAFGVGEALPTAPRTAFAAGDWNVVPVIDGVNHDEARLFLALSRYVGKLRTEASYERVIGDFFGDQAPQVLAEYAGVAKRSPGLAYVGVVTDATFACSAETLDGLLARRAPVYAYVFDDPNAPFSLIPPPFTPPLKAYHSSEIAYVMQTRWALQDPARFNAAQRALSDRMQAAWGEFARTGVPQLDGAPWPSLRSGGAPVELRPDGDRPAGDLASERRCAFWRTLGY
jgi:para-nitrobenzyl esterase